MKPNIFLKNKEEKERENQRLLAEAQGGSYTPPPSTPQPTTEQQIQKGVGYYNQGKGVYNGAKGIFTPAVEGATVGGEIQGGTGAVSSTASEIAAQQAAEEVARQAAYKTAAAETIGTATTTGATTTGATTGGTAVGSGTASGSGTAGGSAAGSAGPWAALAAVIAVNETDARDKGYRRKDHGDYAMDIWSTDVVRQDLEQKILPWFGMEEGSDENAVFQEIINPVGKISKGVNSIFS